MNLKCIHIIGPKAKAGWGYFKVDLYNIRQAEGKQLISIPQADLFPITDISGKIEEHNIYNLS